MFAKCRRLGLNVLHEHRLGHSGTWFVPEDGGPRDDVEREELGEDFKNRPLQERGELAWIPFYQRLQRPTRTYVLEDAEHLGCVVIKRIPYW